MIMAAPRIEFLQRDEEMSMCSSHSSTDKTRIHCAERKAKLLGNWTLRNFKSINRLAKGILTNYVTLFSENIECFFRNS